VTAKSQSVIFIRCLHSNRLWNNTVADAEYSAEALEDVNLTLEVVGSHVLSKQMSDEEAARILIDIANVGANTLLYPYTYD
jgi:hypothetical protein